MEVGGQQSHRGAVDRDEPGGDLAADAIAEVVDAFGLQDAPAALPHCAQHAALLEQPPLAHRALGAELCELGQPHRHCDGPRRQLAPQARGQRPVILQLLQRRRRAAAREQRTVQEDDGQHPRGRLVGDTIGGEQQPQGRQLGRLRGEVDVEEAGTALVEQVARARAAQPRVGDGAARRREDDQPAGEHLLRRLGHDGQVGRGVARPCRVPEQPAREAEPAEQLLAPAGVWVGRRLPG